MSSPKDPLALGEQAWRRRLTAEQYRILRTQGTERPGSSPLNAEWRAGEFTCAGCGQKLFETEAKFDAGCGWPSFSAPVRADAVQDYTDRSHFMVRTEVRCARCDGHLGHVFDDGPGPTGLRYCMNGAALSFKPDETPQ